MTNTKCCIENEKFLLEISVENGVKIEKFVQKEGNFEWIFKPIEIFRLHKCDETIPGSDFEIIKIEENEDKIHKMHTFFLKKDNFFVRLCILENPDFSISIIPQLAVKFENNIPYDIYFDLPALVEIGKNSKQKTYPFKPPVVQGTSFLQLPLCLLNDDSGLCIEFPTDDPHVSMWLQDRTYDFNWIQSDEELYGHKWLLRPDDIYNTMAELKINSVSGGWQECFEKARNHARLRIDMGEYEREDLKWYKDTFLHHFTYLFGKEAYDYAGNRVDIERLLEQGKEFGGYDAITLWHQYPRLGIDDRTQWDFFDDFPGEKTGHENINEIVKIAHKHGVKVFLPYKPWDLKSSESSDDVLQKFCDLIENTGVDGIFLDTMDQPPYALRKAVDKVRPGVVFITELKPANRRAMSILTGSWDQYETAISMPEINLMRFMIPEHFSPIISRRHIGEKKDILIKRAIFNGTGIVVWQDIFGIWLPYSGEQKAKIRRWKTILTDNKANFQGANPLPLYSTLHNDLLCNSFPSDDGKSVIFALYNNSDEEICGEFLECGKTGFAKEIWHGAEILLKNRVISGKIGAKEIFVIKCEA